jgi:hypothetical protein
MVATFLLAAWLLSPAPSNAEEAVNVGGALALLNKPQTARAGVILIPGGDGKLNVKPDGSFSGLKGNQLVRTRKDYLAHGIATLTVDRGVNVAAAVSYMRKVASPVFVVATSRGSLRVPDALAGKPDGVVLTASFLNEIRPQLGAPASLPRTLVVHHRQDGCRHTSPSAVEPFKAWGGPKVTVVWMDGGTNVGDPCEARAYHGFNGLDANVVSTVSKFAASGG